MILKPFPQYAYSRTNPKYTVLETYICSYLKKSRRVYLRKTHAFPHKSIVPLEIHVLSCSSWMLPSIKCIHFHTNPEDIFLEMYALHASPQWYSCSEYVLPHRSKWYPLGKMCNFDNISEKMLKAFESHGNLSISYLRICFEGAAIGIVNLARPSSPSAMLSRPRGPKLDMFSELLPMYDPRRILCWMVFGLSDVPDDGAEDVKPPSLEILERVWKHIQSGQAMWMALRAYPQFAFRLSIDRIIDWSVLNEPFWFVDMITHVFVSSTHCHWDSLRL